MFILQSLKWLQFWNGPESESCECRWLVYGACDSLFYHWYIRTMWVEFELEIMTWLYNMQLYTGTMCILLKTAANDWNWDSSYYVLKLKCVLYHYSKLNVHVHNTLYTFCMWRWQSSLVVYNKLYIWYEAACKCKSNLHKIKDGNYIYEVDIMGFNACTRA